MKLRSVISLLLVFAILSMFGCSEEEDAATPEVPIESTNFSFTEDMVVYMISYTKMMLDGEMYAAGVDQERPLDEQIREGDQSWADYVYEKTLENIEYILLYCEAAHKDNFAITEGMLYKANESITFLSNSASDFGLPVEEYINKLYGPNVTLEGLKVCSQMLALCEGYDLHLQESVELTDDEILKYAEEHPNDLLKFDALRFTASNKVFAETLAATTSKEEFISVMSGVSGIDLTDADKNGITDLIEVNDASVSTDIAGKDAIAEGLAVGDTVITETDGKYIVTMFLSLPKKCEDLLWDLRMIYISSESSKDPYSDAVSLRDQWLEKKGGEEDFINLAARYSDDPSAYYGGRVSVKKGDMPNDSFSSWVCDPERKEGDSFMCPGDENGAYILYFLKGNIPTWQYEAEKAIRVKRAEDHIAEIEDEVRGSFKINEEMLRELIK